MKYLKMFFVFLNMFIVLNVNVYAKILTAEDIAKEFKNTTTYKSLTSLNEDNESSINLVVKDNKLNIMSDNEVIFSFDIYDDYLELDGSSITFEEDNIFSYMFLAIAVNGIADSLFNLSGYKDMTLDDEFLNGITLENIDKLDTKYGIEVKLNNTNTEEPSLKYIRIPLDTEKISNLMDDHGITYEEKNKSEYAKYTPTLKVDNVTENSITLYAKVEEYTKKENEDNFSSFDIPFCDIYRSTSIDGEYEPVQKGISCTGEVGIIDSDLKSDTTYYYKAKVNDGDTFSKVVYASTLVEDDDTVSQDKVVYEDGNEKEEEKVTGTTENPNTGIIRYSLIGLIITIFGIATLKILKKKSLFM